MKRTKVNPSIFVKAAEIAASDKDSFFRYGCNAIQKVINPEVSLTDCWENGMTLPEIKLLNKVFFKDAKKVDFNYDIGVYGFWGRCEIEHNQNARVIGLLLLAEIAKDELQS
jgi:hypothetical protein